MRGKTAYKKRPVKPDFKYNSQKVAKFISYVMVGGKKATATNIVYRALDAAHKKLNQEPLKIFEQAVENASPLLEVIPRRIGGATYLVPVEVRPARRMALAMKAIIKAARAKQGKPMDEFLAEEISGAYNNEGAAITKRNELHKLAEANKAFAHFARFS